MKFRNSAWGLLYLFLFVFVSLAAGKGDAVKGKELFDRRCSPCHGASGEGNDAIAKMFDVTIHPLSSKEVQSQDDAALYKIVYEGRGKMKPLGLSEAEANDVVAFLRSLKK